MFLRVVVVELPKYCWQGRWIQLVPSQVAEGSRVLVGDISSVGAEAVVEDGGCKKGSSILEELGPPLSRPLHRPYDVFEQNPLELATGAGVDVVGREHSVEGPANAYILGGRTILQFVR